MKIHAYHEVFLSLGENNNRKPKINRIIPSLAEIHANDWSLKYNGNAVVKSRNDNPINIWVIFTQIEGSPLKYFQIAIHFRLYLSSVIFMPC